MNVVAMDVLREGEGVGEGGVEWEAVYFFVHLVEGDEEV